MRENHINPKRILVIKAAGIGDAILSVPALRALRSRFPKAGIDLLVTPKCSALFKFCPYVDDIYVIRTQGMRNRVRFADFWDLLRTVYGLRRKHYDLLINLYQIFSNRGAMRMKLLCKAIAARRTLGRNTDGRGGFYDAAISDSWDKVDEDQRHEADLNLEVVKLLGAEDPGRGLEFWVGDEYRAAVREVMAREGLLNAPGPIVALNVGADAVYKRWPEAYFARLGDLLIQKMSATVLIVGGEGDRTIADSVVSAMKKRAVNLAGQLDILELSALLETCGLLVSSDTGPMHLAAAVGTPVVALFGPGRPGRYAPYGPAGFHVVIHHGAACGPCVDFECRERECMKSISPEEVFQKVMERLALKQEACS